MKRIVKLYSGIEKKVKKDIYNLWKMGFESANFVLASPGKMLGLKR